ncbi:hypothetical protein, conserved [Eimeria praecox]|uniref:Uncharacterized protein n=1 Tax=Eimeria praecox TaxID=51316 RepID=U6H1J1_9EIME|nr:hypothetical protein, conserved [Eimeria praecox]
MRRFTAGAVKPLGAVATVVAIAVVLCFCGLATLSQEALGAYGPRPHLGGGLGGGGRGFVPGMRGPIPYGSGMRVPGRLGGGMRSPIPYGPNPLGGGRLGAGGLGHGLRGPGGLMAGRGPGPVMGGTGLGGHMGALGVGGNRQFDYISALHWSNFGPSHQYPSVPMGNLHGPVGTGPAGEAPSGEEPSGEAGTEAGTEESGESSSNMLNYMTQEEGGLSNQQPSSGNSWLPEESEGSSSSESAVAEGMGVEDYQEENEVGHEDAEHHAESPKPAGDNESFLAKRDDKKEHEEKEANEEEPLEARREQLHQEALENIHEKKEEAKEALLQKKEEAKEALLEKKEEAKDKLAKKEEAKDELAKKEEAKKELAKERKQRRRCWKRRRKQRIN